MNIIFLYAAKKILPSKMIDPQQEKIHQIALSFTKGVGSKTFKQLIHHFGSATHAIQASTQAICQISGINISTAQAITQKKNIKAAEDLLIKHQKKKIEVISYQDADYPELLKNIPDSPPIIFYKGDKCHLNQYQLLSIVGTRKATSYGKKVVEKIVHTLCNQNILLVSGLAYGIDIYTHQLALSYGIPTLGVLANGLDITYPAEHKNTAQNMIQNGGLMSEYPLGTPPNTHQFPARNRIIAGISQATIVIEAQKKSGALITAQLANDYNRDVFAVPGNLYDLYSTGCNHLIKTHQAHIFTDIQDLFYILNWPQKLSKEKKITYPPLNTAEKSIVHTLEKYKTLSIDELHYKTQISITQLPHILLDLEIKSIIQAIPGKKFKLFV